MTLLLKSDRKKDTPLYGIFVGLKGKGKSSQETNLRAIIERERNARMEAEKKLNATNSAIMALQFMLQMIQEGREEIHLNPNPLVTNSLYEIEETVLLQNGFQPVGAPEHHWWKKCPEGMKAYNDNTENVDVVIKDSHVTIANGEHLENMSSLLKELGYKVKEFNITESSDRFNPFCGTFDVFGDERKTFVEKLADIFAISVVEEDNSHIRFVYTEKNYIFHSEDELRTMYAGYVALLESMKGLVDIVSVDASIESEKLED